MEELTFKIDINISCPYCGCETYDSIYLNSSECVCIECDKEFYITLYAENLTVESSKI